MRSSTTLALVIISTMILSCASDHKKEISRFNFTTDGFNTEPIQDYAGIPSPGIVRSQPDLVYETTVDKTVYLDASVSTWISADSLLWYWSGSQTADERGRKVEFPVSDTGLYAIRLCIDHRDTCMVKFLYASNEGFNDEGYEDGNTFALREDDRSSDNYDVEDPVVKQPQRSSSSYQQPEESRQISRDRSPSRTGLKQERKSSTTQSTKVKDLKDDVEAVLEGVEGATVRTEGKTVTESQTADNTSKLNQDKQKESEVIEDQQVVAKKAVIKEPELPKVEKKKERFLASTGQLLKVSSTSCLADGARLTTGGTLIITPKTELQLKSAWVYAHSDGEILFTLSGPNNQTFSKTAFVNQGDSQIRFSDFIIHLKPGELWKLKLTTVNNLELTEASVCLLEQRSNKDLILSSGDLGIYTLEYYY